MSSDTLFWSTFTMKDMEKALQEAFNTKATFLPSTKYTDASEGRGFRSNVGLLEIDWSNKDEGLIDKCIAKISTRNRQPADGEIEYESEKADRNAAIMHNKEIIAYERIGHLPMFAKMYAAKKREFETDGYILMEYFKNSQQNREPSSVPNNASNEVLPMHAISQMIESLSYLHAQSGNFSQEEKSELKAPVYGNFFVLLFEKSTYDICRQQMLDFAKGTEIEEDMREFATKVLDEIVQPEYLEFVNSTAERLGIERVLCHGDVWICNTIWNRENEQNGEEKWILKALIDLQTMHFGSAGTDLAQLLCSIASGADRAANWEKYLDDYYRILSERWTGTMPFSFEQLKESYFRAVPLAGYIVVANISEYAAITKDSSGQRKPTKSEEEELQRWIEKAKYALKDILKYHRKNMEMITKKRSY